MNPLRVLCGCEASGVVRRAFRALGHEAWSCDLLPAEDNSPFHLQCDVLTLLDEGWDLGVFFPDCTYLTNSAEWAYGNGPYHQKVKPGTLVGEARRAAREEAILFVKQLWAAPIERIAIENPVGCLGTRWRSVSQFVQPYEFGDDASKKTGLFLKNLPLLIPTTRYPGRWVEWPRGSGKMVERWGNQTDGGQNKLPPTDDRWMLRSRTYEGLAAAFAAQWSIGDLF